MATTKTTVDTLNDTPDWPTPLRGRLSGARALGVDNSVWIYYAVPMSPVADAKNPNEVIAAAEPLHAAFDELAAMAKTTGGRRATSRQGYRQIHTLLVNLPRWWRPQTGHPNESYLAEAFPGTQETRERVLLLGVRLVDKIGGAGGFKAAVDSVVETLTSGGVPISDFDVDAKAVSAALTRSGLRELTPMEWRLASAWWNQGAAPDAPMLVQPDCIHVFSNAAQVSSAALAIKEGRTEWQDIAASTTVTMATVQDIDLQWESPLEARSQWVTQLVDQDALAISIRGRVEPASITYNELRRNRKRYEEDIRDRIAQNKMERAEQEEQATLLKEVSDVYAKGGPATIVDASVVVGFSGYVPDLTDLSQGLTAKLNSMLYRQRAALSETQLCSPVRANPHLHDLPAQTIAASGIPSLSVVGDKTGAVVGWTERDKQCAYIDHMAASDADTLPLAIVAGATGSGKTMLALNLADQWSRQKTPVVFVDPKMGSDHSGTVLAAGGQVVSLDNLASADGIFDPIRFSPTAEIGVDLATSVLLSVNPWGSSVKDYEAPLMYALHYGVSHGATCTGEALRIAGEAGHVPQSLVDEAFKLAESSPMFRACFGINPGSESLRVADTVTLIKVGDAHLELPNPGSDLASQSLPKRIGAALIRMMVFGSAIAMTGRDGVVMLDEAWVFLSAGRDEVERLGRLARSQRVFPMLFTQRVTDAVNAGLTGYISRGMILPIEDESEARAACTLFKLEPTKERIDRITAQGEIGAAGGGTAPNWDSMRALRDPATGKVIRGAIGIYADLAKRAVPVQIDLSPIFLARASTNAGDIRARKAAEERARLLAEHAAHQVAENPTPTGFAGW